MSEKESMGADKDGSTLGGLDVSSLKEDWLSEIKINSNSL